MDHQHLLEKLLIALYLQYDERTESPRVILQGWSEVTPDELEYIRSVRPTPDEPPFYIEEDEDAGHGPINIEV